MARNGYPDDPDNYSESDPTQYANYGGTSGEAYSEYGPPTGYPSYTAPTAEVGNTGRYAAPVPPPTPWHQRPAVLVGLGVLTAAVLALLVYAVVKFTNSGTAESPAVTSSTAAPTSSASTSAPTTGSSAAEPTQTAAPSPSTTAAPPPPTTYTTTVTPTTTAAPTTTEAPSTTTSVTTSVTTVTETTTKPLFPNWPRPKPTLLEPAPAG